MFAQASKTGFHVLPQCKSLVPAIVIACAAALGGGDR